MSITEALLDWSLVKDDSVGVKTGGAGFGDDALLTGERGLVTFKAVGGAFLLPFRVDLLGVVVIIVGSDGASLTRCFMVEYRLLDKIGTLKLGVEGGEELCKGRAGMPNAECGRKGFGCGSIWQTCIVCMERLRSFIAYALGRGRTSSVEILGGKSSNVDVLSRVGELEVEDPCDVIKVL